MGEDLSTAFFSLAKKLIHQPDELVGVSTPDLVL